MTPEERRAHLTRHPPFCPACEEAEQLQLLDCSTPKTRWRCRICKHRFEVELKERP